MDGPAVRLNNSTDNVGQPASFTVHDTNGGVGMTNHNIERLDQLTTFILKHLDIHRKIVLGSIGFLSLEPLDLSSNLVDLVLDGGVRGDLHREYRVD